MVQTHKAISSSSTKAIKCYGTCISAVIMDEEQLIKKACFIMMDNLITIAIFMAVLVRKTKLVTTITKDFFNVDSLFQDG